MKYSYTPKGICPSKIDFEIEDGIVRNIEYTGGCHGNLQAVSRLLDGMPAAQIKEKLSGIKCGRKSTSCSDQLVKGIDEALRSAGK